MPLPEETDSRETETVCAAMSDRLRALVVEKSRLVAEALIERRLVDRRHAFAFAFASACLSGCSFSPAASSQQTRRS